MDNNQRQWFTTSYMYAHVPEVLPLEKRVLETIEKQLTDQSLQQAVSLKVHKHDVMYLYSLYNHAEQPAQALTSYFLMGAKTANNLRKIAAEHKLNTKRIMDFGTGYGRSLRFFPSVFPDSTICATEIKTEAVEFVKKHFVQEAYNHASEVEETLPWPEQDLILAQSVFTHLPEHLFRDWLKALYKSLLSGGALVFTFKDMDKNRQHLGRIKQFFYPKDFVYLKSSEDIHFPFLPNQNKLEDYGVSFVSKSYLKSQTEELGGEIHFIGDALSGAQAGAILLKK
jgi:SAM-dependent methyltransferase